jgi:membrane fusion protein (multidrug efflux system)
MKTSHLERIAVGAAVVAALLAGCGGQEGKPGAAGPGAGNAPPPPEVTVVTVGKTEANLTQDLPGRLEAYRVAQVRARVDGIVEKRLFTEGSDVKVGTTLFQIDPRSYRAAYAAARADVDVSRQTRDRYQQLLEVKAVSQQDYDLAVAKLRAAEAALARAELDLENTNVPAPISGRIGRELATVGALVGHGEATNLAVIEQIDPIYANFTEPGADEMRLKKDVAAGKLKRNGAALVELVLEDGSIYPEKGKLLFSDQVVDPTTGSIAIRAIFPNPRHDLLPGMFATIRFSGASADHVIKLPQRAVMVGPQGQFVLVVDADGKVAARPVKTGSMADGDFVIDEGVQVGEQVIVDGLQKARPGMTVKPVPLEPPVPPDNVNRDNAPAGTAPSGNAPVSKNNPASGVDAPAVKKQGA